MTSTELNIERSVTHVINESNSDRQLDCFHVFKPETKHGWQVVSHNHTTFVFSAFIDPVKHEVTLIGIIKMTTRRTLKRYCYFWNQNSTIYDRIEARIVELPEAHGKEYGAALFKCPLLGMEPEVVSLMESKCAQPHNGYTPLSIQPLNPRPSRFTLCVAPFNNNFNDVSRFVDKVELTRLLGVDKFIMYEYKMGRELREVIFKYKRLSMPMELHFWRLPPNRKRITLDFKQNLIHYTGQMVAIQDCLYRTKGSSDYVIFNDIDEFFIPAKHDTLAEMIDDINGKTENSSRIGAYLLPNVFFPLNQTASKNCIRHNSSMSKDPIIPLCNLKKDSRMFPYGIRSKYIVIPDMIRQLSIHKPFKFHNDFFCHNVDPKDGIMHHYRQWDLLEQDLVQDDSVLRYEQKLTERLSKCDRDILN